MKIALSIAVRCSRNFDKLRRKVLKPLSPSLLVPKIMVGVEEGEGYCNHPLWGLDLFNARVVLMANCGLGGKGAPPPSPWPFALRLRTPHR